MKTFEELANLYAEKIVNDEEFEEIELNENIIRSENCGFGAGIYTNLKIFTFFSKNDDDDFDVYVEN